MKSLERFIVSVVLALLMCVSSWAQGSDRDRGIDLYREGKFAEAISALEAAVTANENDRSAWTYLGASYVRSDDDKKALAAFRRAFQVKQPVAGPRSDRTVKVTHKPHPRYSRQARANMSTGKIRVAVEFRADGTIGFTFPVAQMNDDLVPPSIEAAKGIQFEPALKDGKPITVINFVEYGYWIQ